MSWFHLREYSVVIGCGCLATLTSVGLIIASCVSQYTLS